MEHLLPFNLATVYVSDKELIIANPDKIRFWISMEKIGIKIFGSYSKALEEYLF